MVDAHFGLPRLAEIHDALDGDRSDLDVVGVDPAAASLEVARRKWGVGEVREAPDRPGLEVVFVARSGRT